MGVSGQGDAQLKRDSSSHEIDFKQLTRNNIYHPDKDKQGSGLELNPFDDTGLSPPKEEVEATAAPVR